ncbi:hypothetical protein NBH00_14605 [Paraconexibacter antarcticus]|uniref:Uncharacterized protein n=1 Tax=Paraconexibacter antarcticus TaxID=2949664 RepID=A0ABY5DM17_9ACTN|nr:hypothetical protein [Paraconexibacter antarcticus]UTI62591.1 hypothetical protein NBH00_14605 [Paraconexibacter antarcticus]
MSPMRSGLAMLLMTFGLAAGMVSLAAAQTTAPAPALPLSAARAAAVGPVIDYAQVLDATKPLRAKLARYAGACRRLPVGDTFITAYRALCRTEGDAYTAGLVLPTCRSADRCRARLTRYAADLGLQMNASRRFNRVLKTTVTDPDCRRALRLRQAVLLTAARLQRQAAAVVKLIGGDPRKLGAAVGKFYAIDRSALLDHRGRLDTFRAACQ